MGVLRGPHSSIPRVRRCSGAGRTRHGRTHSAFANRKVMKPGSRLSFTNSSGYRCAIASIGRGSNSRSITEPAARKSAHQRSKRRPPRPNTPASAQGYFDDLQRLYIFMTWPSSSLRRPRACASPQTFGRQPNHLAALVEAHHVGTPSGQLLRIDTRATAGVENSLATNLAEQLKHRRPVVVRVVGALKCVNLEFGGELVVLASWPRRIHKERVPAGHLVERRAEVIRKRPRAPGPAWPARAR
jgi:hypothetical protein